MDVSLVTTETLPSAGVGQLHGKQMVGVGYAANGVQPTEREDHDRFAGGVA